MSGLLPDLKVEVGFGAFPGGGDYFVLDDPVQGVLDNTDYALAPDAAWIDVTDDLDLIAGPVTIRRGRSRELDRYQAGVASFVLRNEDRKYDPLNTSSPYADQLKPRRRVRISAEGDGWTRWLFAGFIDDFPVRYEPADRSSVEVTCSDAFTILAGMEIANRASVWAGDLTGVRVARVLDLTEVDFPQSRSIDDGLSTVVAFDGTANVLTHLHLMEQTEYGYLFCAADGTLTFRNRHTALNADADAVLVDGEAAAGDGITYSSLALGTAALLLHNRVVVTDGAGTEHTAEDADSRAEYLTATLPVTTALDDSEEADGLAQYLVSRYADPEVRFTAASFSLGFIDNADQDTLLGLELTNVAEVARVPPGTGTPTVLEKTVLVDGVTHAIRHDEWVTTFDFASVDTRSFFEVGDAVFGVLDESRLAY